MSIEVKNLKYTYNPGMPGETLAINDVSFEVHDGETIGIIGHTGSGKSTLLQHLNGLIKPDSGEVWVDGQCITDGSTKLVDIRRKVGLVFQYPEYQLFEETVAKDIAFGPRNTGIPEDQIETRVRAAMSIVGLDYDEIAESSPFELSGGQKRRVAIAGILAMNPKVLVLDEPTAGLDPKGAISMMSLFWDLNKKHGKTILIVTHDMEHVFHYCDNVIVMADGKVSLHTNVKDFFKDTSLCKELNILPPALLRMKDLLKENGFDVPEDVMDETALAKCIARQVKKHG